MLADRDVLQKHGQALQGWCRATSRVAKHVGWRHDGQYTLFCNMSRVAGDVVDAPSSAQHVHVLQIRVSQHGISAPCNVQTRGMLRGLAGKTSNALLATHCGLQNNANFADTWY
jgi:hypothetical protein